MTRYRFGVYMALTSMLGGGSGGRFYLFRDSPGGLQDMLKGINYSDRYGYTLRSSGSKNEDSAEQEEQNVVEDALGKQLHTSSSFA